MITLNPTFYTGTKSILVYKRALATSTKKLEQLKERFLSQGNAWASDEEAELWEWTSREVTTFSNQIAYMSNSDRDRIIVEVGNGSRVDGLNLREDLRIFNNRDAQIGFGMLCEILKPMMAGLNALRFYDQVMRNLSSDGWTIWAWQIEDWYLSHGIKAQVGKSVEDCEGK